MSGNTSGKTCESVTERMNSVRDLSAEELIVVCGGDGPPGCIPDVNCIGDSSLDGDGW